MDQWSPQFYLPESGIFELDDRAFLLGLDHLYRQAVKQLESETLLPLARNVAGTLGVAPANLPIEGYYGETAALTEYFRWMRALQLEDQSREAAVKDLTAFRDLFHFCSSPIFGEAVRENKLLPQGLDPLGWALKQQAEAGQVWTLASLLETAFRATEVRDDISLVGLAARARDAVCLTALRESVVLYAKQMHYGISEEPDCVWRVSPEIQAAANRFIMAFDELAPGRIPSAEPGYVNEYYKAMKDADLIGRCVRIGSDGGGGNHYHWAIYRPNLRVPLSQVAVEDFWHPQVWTTDAYREEGHPNAGPFFSPSLEDRVAQAKRKVQDALGGKPGPDMRSSTLYQAYTGLCAEAQIAMDEHSLTLEIVQTLEEYAAKVIKAQQSS